LDLAQILFLLLCSYGGKDKETKFDFRAAYEVSLTTAKNNFNKNPMNDSLEYYSKKTEAIYKRKR